MTSTRNQRRRLKKGDRVRNFMGAIETVALVLDGGSIVVTDGFDGDGYWRAMYTRAGLRALPRPHHPKSKRKERR